MSNDPYVTEKVFIESQMLRVRGDLRDSNNGLHKMIVEYIDRVMKDQVNYKIVDTAIIGFTKDSICFNPTSLRSCGVMSNQDMIFNQTLQGSTWTFADLIKHELIHMFAQEHLQTRADPYVIKS